MYVSLLLLHLHQQTAIKRFGKLKFMEKFKDGDKVVLKTSREIKTLKKAIRNDILIITARMGRGGYGVSDVLGNYIGTVRHSDIKSY